eukprot:TRINITY_DN11577_c0_g1_i1.p1 TRINITY_DN11577_c0_g1~~TRINITY_DN11577_c0_g1_i1.p1  ORF type:complete len:168 (-),score=36.90 TRINITY_DN11577_c0_g1_i1:156-659(-)
MSAGPANTASCAAADESVGADALGKSRASPDEQKSGTVAARPRLQEIAWRQQREFYPDPDEESAVSASGVEIAARPSIVSNTSMMSRTFDNSVCMCGLLSAALLASAALLIPVLVYLKFSGGVIGGIVAMLAGAFLCSKKEALQKSFGCAFFIVGLAAIMVSLSVFL